jgi:hypothetical protein
VSKIKKCFCKVKSGAYGVFRAAIGIGKAHGEEVSARRTICRECDKAEPCLRAIEKCKCSECGCLLRIKTSLKSEKCPIGKW